MPKQLALSVFVEMPDNPFDAAEVYARLRDPWDTLANTLKQAGVVHSIKQDEIETRAKPVRRPRKVKEKDDKPKLVTTTPDAA